MRSCPQTVSLSHSLCMFSIFDHCLVTHPQTPGVCGMGVCQKSVFHARAHFCQDIIPWDLFVYAIFFFFSFCCCCYFSFRFCPPPISPPPLDILLLLQLFFIVTDPEASRAVAGHLRPAYACVGSFGPQISTSF